MCISLSDPISTTLVYLPIAPNTFNLKQFKSIRSFDLMVVLRAECYF